MALLGADAVLRGGFMPGDIQRFLEDRFVALCGEPEPGETFGDVAADTESLVVGNAEILLRAFLPPVRGQLPQPGGIAGVAALVGFAALVKKVRAGKEPRLFLGKTVGPGKVSAGIDADGRDRLRVEAETGQCKRASSTDLHRAASR